MARKAKRILTAEEHTAKIVKLETQKKREEREFRERQKRLEDIQDLRDDVMALIRNSKMDWEDIHAKFGPTVQTLHRWDQKTVKSPQLGKMRTALRAIGKDFYIGEYKPKK